MKTTDERDGKPSEAVADRRRDDWDAAVRLIVAVLCFTILFLCAFGLSVWNGIGDGFDPDAEIDGFTVFGAVLFIMGSVLWGGFLFLLATLFSFIGLVFSLSALRHSARRGMRIASGIFTALHGVVCLPCVVMWLIVLVGAFI